MLFGLRGGNWPEAAGEIQSLRLLNPLPRMALCSIEAPVLNPLRRHASDSLRNSSTTVGQALLSGSITAK